MATDTGTPWRDALQHVASALEADAETIEATNRRAMAAALDEAAATQADLVSDFRTTLAKAAGETVKVDDDTPVDLAIMAALQVQEQERIEP